MTNIYRCLIFMKKKIRTTERRRMTPSQKLSGSDQNHQEKSQWADGDDGKDNQGLAEKVLKKVETLDQCLLNHQTIDSIQSLNYFQRSTEIFHIRSITSATVNNDSNKRTGIVSIDLDSSSSLSSSRPSFHNLTNNTQPIRFISDPENLIESNQPLVAVRFDPSLQSLNLSFNFYLNHSKLVNSLTTLDHSHTGTGSKPKVAFIASDSINSLYQLLTNLTSSSTLTDQTPHGQHP
ncbi:hypothetical protein BY996DRAFT_1344402 [Phakopsora pachyrhizi]|nr:hypothetical protein BY996DRAFT_1344402 [Phakopsora pachyrhizi]